MTRAELRAASTLAGIFSLRMLGLFMILPVFSLYAGELDGYTPLLLGLAIGIYGLTQALLQIPFGMVSDRIGRKPVILFGLALFAAGSVVAAVSDTMVGVVIGGAIQGSGAIAAAVLALAADLTREEHRTKAMAIIGISIGLSFALALMIGPLLNTWIGVPGIFWATAGLAVLGMLLLGSVPRPVHSRLHREAEVEPSQLGRVLADTQLLRLDFGILALHAILAASFVALPLALRDAAGLDAKYHWLVYLLVLVLSVAAMVPFIFLAERRQRMKQVFLGAIIVLGLGQVGLVLFHGGLVGLVAALVVYFAAFNLLEATLPSLVSRLAPAGRRGTAMGVYTSSQFFGVFLGGAIGGWVYGEFGFSGVFSGCALLTGIWLLLAAGMTNPRSLRSYVLRVGEVDERRASELVSQLTRVGGVAEAVVLAEEGVAYLKVDSKTLDEEALRKLSAAHAA